MAHPNKIRGNNLEREIVNKAKDKGLSAKRAYASDGRSLGKSEVVDVIVEGYTVQAKRRKKIAQWLYPENHGDDVDVVCTRMDRKEPLIVMPLEEWLELIKIKKEINNGNE
tara:strand:- start:1069 stop:1401 length:333 start_codon:yes stop_codon:yes gene_type:complete